MGGKFIAITGAGSETGRRTAIRCAELGAGGVTFYDVNIEGLEETQKTISTALCKLLIEKVDISQEAAVDTWIETAVVTFGCLDGAANVAGLSQRQLDTTTANIKKSDRDTTVSVNFTGTMHCMRAQLKVITKPWGSIVNISSGAGLKGVTGLATYSATKWGLRGLTKCAAAEFGPQSVRVNTLMPAPINFGENFERAVVKGLVDKVKFASTTAIKRLGRMEEVANVIVFLLSDDASYVTRADITVDGGRSCM